MRFALHPASGPASEIDVPVDRLVIAGWTGRDAVQVEHHIAELERIGVARPSTIPAFYRVGANLLTTAGTVEVLGDTSSGEVEFVLFATAQGLLIGIGSDHTDRELEAASVARSKQVCPKPVGDTLWRFDDVREHWDALELRSYATVGSVRRRYQAGPVAKMLDPRALLYKFGSGPSLPPGTAMFCGTLPVEGDIAPAERFEVELVDTVRGRTLRHEYTARVLPVVA